MQLNTSSLSEGPQSQPWAYSQPSQRFHGNTAEQQEDSFGSLIRHGRPPRAIATILSNGSFFATFLEQSLDATKMLGPTGERTLRLKQAGKREICAFGMLVAHLLAIMTNTSQRQAQAVIRLIPAIVV